MKKQHERICQGTKLYLTNRKTFAGASLRMIINCKEVYCQWVFYRNIFSSSKPSNIKNIALRILSVSVELYLFHVELV